VLMRVESFQVMFGDKVYRKQQQKRRCRVPDMFRLVLKFHLNKKYSGCPTSLNINSFIQR